MRKSLLLLLRAPRVLVSTSLLLPLLVAPLLLGGCPQGKPAEPPATPSATTTTTAPTTTAPATTATTPTANAGGTTDPKTLVVNGCLSCHLEDMLAQQRLTQAQWKKVVDKMVKWGAPLDTKEADIVTAYLASSYGLDAGGFDPPTISAASAAEEIAKVAESGPPGNAARGAEIYASKCGDCHGHNGRGLLGVSLVDKPILDRPADFMKVLDQGRGKMPKTPLSPAESADVRAHLRSLKNPPH